jgi:hypothetical protein
MYISNTTGEVDSPVWGRAETGKLEIDTSAGGRANRDGSSTGRPVRGLTLVGLTAAGVDPPGACGVGVGAEALALGAAPAQLVKKSTRTRPTTSKRLFIQPPITISWIWFARRPGRRTNHIPLSDD